MPSCSATLTLALTNRGSGSGVGSMRVYKWPGSWAKCDCNCKVGKLVQQEAEWLLMGWVTSGRR